MWSYEFPNKVVEMVRSLVYFGFSTSQKLNKERVSNC